jgi:drug/metabolite transporter (DMT)-like permease
MLRYVILIIPLVLYMHFSCGLKSAVKALKEDYVIFILIAFTSVALPNLTQNLGMSMNNESSVSSILQSSGPIYMVILAMIFLKERMGTLQYFGLVLGLVGSVLLATNGLSMMSGGTFTGNMLIMCSAVSYAVASVMGKNALKRHNPMIVISWTTIIGSVMLVPPVFAEPLAFPSANGWIIIITLSVTSSFLAYILWYTVMAYTDVSRLATTVYLIPVMTIGLSYWLLNERLSMEAIVFSAMIIAGVIAASIEYKPKKKEKKG